MKSGALFFVASLLTTSAGAAPVVLLESLVRIVAETLRCATANTTKLELTLQHGTSKFMLSVLQRGNAIDALAAQKSTSGWKDRYLFIRDDCLVDDPALAAWRSMWREVATRSPTMRAYNMQGTPTTLLVDASGRLRKHHFGMEDDARLIAGIGQLIAERARR